MTARLPYLPREGKRFDELTVGSPWCAVAVPMTWGPRVLTTLGDLGGPVFEDPGRLHLVWPLPEGAAADWPDLTAIRVVRYGPGDELIVPARHRTLSGMCWLWPPEEDRPYVDVTTLRRAIETLIGPLEEAAAKGEVEVCHFCGAVTAAVVLVAWGKQESGPGWSWYACQPCAAGRGLKDVTRS
ncbi:hypothetical protein ABZ990_14700 [Streptomyces sp. NPDC046203]|uniref:hypothetical protein n=1 Tax=Streptomyces sp. NPDC046203 TaxID=3154602 RepID=UPI0033FDC355